MAEFAPSVVVIAGIPCTRLWSVLHFTGHRPCGSFVVQALSRAVGKPFGRQSPAFETLKRGVAFSRKRSNLGIQACGRSVRKGEAWTNLALLVHQDPASGRLVFSASTARTGSSLVPSSSSSPAGAVDASRSDALDRGAPPRIPDHTAARHP